MSEIGRLIDELRELDAQFSHPGTCGEAAAELTRLRAEVDVLRADAEAFRASVKLRISIAHHSNRCTAHAEGMAINGVCEQFYKDDPCAATRAAIDAARAALSQETPK